MALTSLAKFLQEPIQKGASLGMTHELREHDPKHTFRVQVSKPVASDSNTDSTRPSPESSETRTIGSQEVQTPNDVSQTSTSEVKEGEISFRLMTPLRLILTG
ncbi:UNVERIFIED_CONTAM: hypothetical protein Sradi_6645200 [Sesamum radiatum]|uniref:Uncharacterized protein n=1 Tax=Sesamum radiatum TaxID=300843 RepID=A0AAW2JQJ4_SESRA